MHGSKEHLRRLAEAVQGRSVYLTVDLDFFDPSLMPSVGTPEPGGLGWQDALEIVRTLTAHSQILCH